MYQYKTIEGMSFDKLAECLNLAFPIITFPYS